jgi:hypothetical protein
VVRVSIEVRNGAARFNVAVLAQSIRRARSIAENRYPGSDVKVQFPTDPDGFFGKDPAAKEGPCEFVKRGRMAA